MENAIEIRKQNSNEQICKNKENASSFFKDMHEYAKKVREFSNGANKAYWTWCYSDCQGEVVMTDFLLERDVHDFINTMRAAGVKSFIFANSSTAVMNNLHEFVKEGCKIGKLVSIEHDVMGDGKWIEKKEGIRIIL